MLVQAMLGISAHAPERRLTVDRPRLPDWLQSLDICDIRVGRSRLSLAFRQTRPGATGFSLLEQHGDVRVTMSA